MIDEAKPHTRNLKLISISFIFYWLLELEPATETLQLPLLNFKVTNPEPLPWLAWVSLVYFFWRFWLTVSNYISQKYVNNLSIYANQSLSRKAGLLARYLSYSVQKHFKNDLYDEFDQELKTEERRSGTELKFDKLHDLKIAENGTGGHIRFLAIAKPESGNLRPSRSYTKQLNLIELWAIKIKITKDLVLKSEESADFLLPITLFIIAVLCGVLIHIGVPAPI